MLDRLPPEVIASILLKLSFSGHRSDDIGKLFLVSKSYQSALEDERLWHILITICFPEIDRQQWLIGPDSRLQLATGSKTAKDLWCLLGSKRHVLGCWQIMAPRIEEKPFLASFCWRPDKIEGRWLKHVGPLQLVMSPFISIHPKVGTDVNIYKLSHDTLSVQKVSTVQRSKSRTSEAVADVALGTSPISQTSSAFEQAFREYVTSTHRGGSKRSTNSSKTLFSGVYTLNRVLTPYFAAADENIQYSGLYFFERLADYDNHQLSTMFGSGIIRVCAKSSLIQCDTLINMDETRVVSAILDPYCVDFSIQEASAADMGQAKERFDRLYEIFNRKQIGVDDAPCRLEAERCHAFADDFSRSSGFQRTRHGSHVLVLKENMFSANLAIVFSSSDALLLRRLNEEECSFFNPV